MAETHLWMVVVPFAMAMWWTESWLMNPIVARWRFAVAAFAGTILWVYLAYASTRAVEASSGVVVAYGSVALSWFSVFMALVSIVGLILGLFLWVEEEGEHAARTLPNAVRSELAHE